MNSDIDVDVDVSTKNVDYTPYLNYSIPKGVTKMLDVEFQNKKKNHLPKNKLRH